MKQLLTTFGAAFALLIASLAVTPPAGAAVLHATGGSGNCTTELLGCSLSDALASADDGDVIRVHAGVHGIGSAVSDATPGVSVQGAPDEPRPVIAIAGAASGLRLVNGTNLSGVDIVSTSDIAVRAIGGLIERVRISAHGSNVTGIELGDGAIVRNSTVSANGASAVGVRVASNGTRTELRGASVVATGGGATAALVAPSGPWSSSLRAVNSVLRGYSGAGDVRAVTSASETATIVLDHSATTPSGISVSGPGSAIDNSRSPLTADPLFVDRANLDLRQTSMSPTIDAGTADLDGDGHVDAADTAEAGPTDLDGTPRQLGLPDIGSDEREMPPIVLSAEPVVTDGRLALRVVVQPRGLSTVVTAEWSTGTDTATASGTADASGNSPVSVDLPLADVPPGSQIAVRARASNSAGSSLSDESTVAVPEAPVTTTITTVAPPATTPAAPAPLPGALPTLVSAKLRSHWGILAVKLQCKQKISCRGLVMLTRLGSAARWIEFKIAPGASKTVSLTLTSAQTRKLRKDAVRGVRVLLELRSTQMGSSFQAIRIKGDPKAPAATAKPTAPTAASKR